MRNRKPTTRVRRLVEKGDAMKASRDNNIETLLKEAEEFIREALPELARLAQLEKERDVLRAQCRTMSEALEQLWRDAREAQTQNIFTHKALNWLARFEERIRQEIAHQK